ncbi:unnamed protein product, partial [Discosporangium mesarthrocarpum]
LNTLLLRCICNLRRHRLLRRETKRPDGPQTTVRGDTGYASGGGNATTREQRQRWSRPGESNSDPFRDLEQALGITIVGPLFPTERTLFGSIQVNAWWAGGFYHFSKYGSEYIIRDATVGCDDESRETKSPDGPQTTIKGDTGYTSDGGKENGGITEASLTSDDESSDNDVRDLGNQIVIPFGLELGRLVYSYAPQSIRERRIRWREPHDNYKSIRCSHL